MFEAPERPTRPGVRADFVEAYKAKYASAAECLSKDREVLLAFYDFPAEHWLHLRTTNPIERVFATVWLRTAKTKGAGSRVACLSMVFKLVESAARSGVPSTARTSSPTLSPESSSSMDSNPKDSSRDHACIHNS